MHARSEPLPLWGCGEWTDTNIWLQRSVSHTISLESTYGLEALGFRVVNNSLSLSVSLDKTWTLSKLLSARLPIPKTGLAFSLEDAFKIAVHLGYPVVVKPVDGSWGALVSLARDEEELRSIIEHRLRIPGSSSKVHMIQEYVRKPGRDIRVMVVGDEVVAGIYRISNHWVTNTSRGGRAEPVKPDDELTDLSLRAAEAVGGEVLGVDVFEDPSRGYLVNEVNGVPEFKNIQRVTGVDVASSIAEYLLEQVRR